MLRKHLSKTGRKCRVTFKTQRDGAESALLLGEFNDWNPDTEPMRRLKDGSFSLTLSLDTGRDYRFRYLFDGEQWANDDAADDYEPNTFGGQNSVVRI